MDEVKELESTNADTNKSQIPSIATENQEIDTTPKDLEISTKPKLWRGPHYRKIHENRLPLNVYPLPFYAPHNPLSLLHVLYVLVKDYFLPKESHPAQLFRGYLSAATRSVHVTDPKTVRALWEMGFFGKGNLSRSEPTWLLAERRRLGLEDPDGEGETRAREIKEERRLERERFKTERARLEREAIEKQKRVESGLPLQTSHESGEEAVSKFEDLCFQNGAETESFESDEAQREKTRLHPQIQDHDSNQVMVSIEKESAGKEFSSPNEALANVRHDEDFDSTEPVDQEHLQLSFDEAFFLSYALGVLQVFDPTSKAYIKDQRNLLQIFRQQFSFPSKQARELVPDDRFLLSYVVYHHFRSLGWVVRDGVKFAVDYLLYMRGPVFTHAAFAVVIIPSYTHRHWFDTPERAAEVEKKKAKYSWHWLHCINRVQARVMKTLVLVYVDVPPPLSAEDEEDLGKLFGGYKVREFCVQRWSPNRNRDAKPMR